ncbi:MAG TPA: hypothetical protein VMX13_12810 [Sedimentisphaerales bacterium]|nr:hypothetical protein [Sedimentisphaerales bacterium]
MSTDEQIQLLEKLEALLLRQITLAQEEKISAVELLGKQADSLVTQIAETSILDQPEFQARRNQLQALYDSLCLAVTAQKADIAEKLSLVRRGKRTLGAYKSNTR